MLPFALVGGGRLFARPWPVVTALVAGAALLAFVLLALARPDAFAPFCSDLEESVQAQRAAAGSRQALLCRWGAIPDELHEGRDLHTALTATVLHSGWLHLGGNLAYLLVFGPLVERRLGAARFLLLLAAAALAAQAAHVAGDPNATEPTVGLSGALAGVLAVHLVVAGRGEVRVLVGPVPLRLPTWFVIGFWAVQQVVLTVVLLRRVEVTGGVAYEAHAAGFLLGLVLGRALLGLDAAQQARGCAPQPGR